MTVLSTPPAPAAVPKPRRRRRRWIPWTIAILVIGISVWLLVAKLPGFLNGPAVSGTSPEGAPAVTRRIQATLFYLSDGGTELVATAREVLYGATPVEQAKRILEAEVQPPPAGKLSPIPAGTTVRAVFLTDKGDAYVDLGGTIVSGHTGGSLDEALTVYAIVDAMTVNLPNVSAVQILINDKQVDTLVGHLDLRYPLAKTLDWVQKGP